MQITISIILAVGKWWCSWVCSLVTITREEDSVAAQEEYSNSYKTSAQKGHRYRDTFLKARLRLEEFGANLPHLTPPDNRKRNRV